MLLDHQRRLVDVASLGEEWGYSIRVMSIFALPGYRGRMTIRPLAQTGLLFSLVLTVDRHIVGITLEAFFGV
jgi:hypothetical protein